MRTFKNLNPDKRFKEVTEFLWSYVCHRDHGLCQICGRVGQHVHHVEYRSHNRNGHYANNLILLCGVCHSIEHDKAKNDVIFYIERIQNNEKKFKETLI